MIRLKSLVENLVWIKKECLGGDCSQKGIIQIVLIHGGLGACSQRHLDGD